MFCHVAKHMYSVLCDINCWLRMKYLWVNKGGGKKGTQVLKWSCTALLKLSVRNYSGHTKNRKSSTIIPNLRDKWPYLLLAKCNSVALIRLFSLLKWAQVITELRTTHCLNAGQWTGMNGAKYPCRMELSVVWWEDPCISQSLDRL